MADSEAGLDADECRICGETTLGNSELISPCDCSGSMGKVHTACLQRWIEARPAHHSLTCETCGVDYRIAYERRIVYDREHLCIAQGCYHACDFLMLLITLGCVLFMTAVVVPRLEDEGESRTTIVLIYAMSGLLLVFACFTLRKVYNRWYRATSIPTVVGEAPRDEAPAQRQGAAARVNRQPPQAAV